MRIILTQSGRIVNILKYTVEFWLAWSAWSVASIWGSAAGNIEKLKSRAYTQLNGQEYVAATLIIASSRYRNMLLASMSRGVWLFYLGAFCPCNTLTIWVNLCGGWVAEWSKAAVLKPAEPQGSVGSNPTPSAISLFAVVPY